MTFKEKIDKILTYNKLGINSVSALEDKIEAGRGAINEFYNENREPGRKTLKKIKSFPGLNENWYDTGKGEIFIENSTSVEKQKTSKENREPIYQTIIEGHTEYVLVPRTVLDKTQLVSSDQINRTWDELAEKNRELERKNKQIDFYQEQIAKLLSGVELASKSSNTKEI